jgi:hypothetical protein
MGLSISRSIVQLHGGMAPNFPSGFFDLPTAEAEASADVG